MKCPLYEALLADVAAAGERVRSAAKGSGEALIDSEINLEHLQEKLSRHVSECLMCAARVN